MTNISNISDKWNNIYQDKKLDNSDINNLATAIKKDGVKPEEISFLESKLKSLSPEDKKLLSSLITNLKSQVSSSQDFKPTDIKFGASIQTKQIEQEMESVKGLLNSGKNKEAASKMSILLEKVQKSHTDNNTLIDNIKIGLASIYSENNDKKALPILKELQKNPALKEQSKVLEVQFHIKNGDISKAMPLVNELSKSKNSELAKMSKDLKIQVESKYLETIGSVSQNNIDMLNQIKTNKTPQSMASLLNPLTSVKMISGHYDNLQEVHDSNINKLSDLKAASTFAKIAIKNSGKNLTELTQMSVSDISKSGKIPVEYASIIKNVSQSNPDFKKIISGDYNQNFSWDKNKPYISGEYLDTEWDTAAKWIGNQVRSARETDNQMMMSNSAFERAAGKFSATVLDTLSDGNQLAKMLIKNAHEYYNDKENSGTFTGYVGGKVGNVLTTAGDIIASPVTTVATQFDHKATDSERADALKDIALTYGTLGVAKAGAPAFKTIGQGISKGASKVAKPLNNAVLKGMETTVDATRFVLNKATADKLIRTTSQLKQAAVKIGVKIEKGFDDLLTRNILSLEGKGFKVPKNMDDFVALTAKDPIKAQSLVTNALLEEKVVKKGLDKILSEAKKGLNPTQLKNFDDFEAIQKYMLKNPEKFYDEFGGLATSHFAKGLSPTELKKAGFEYFSHYTNQNAMPKILSSGKILEQKWDVLSGPLSNLTQDLAKGKLKPGQFVEQLKKAVTETRTFGFRGHEPLNLSSLTRSDLTVASLNTAKTPEAVINVLVPTSKIDASHGWKKAVQNSGANNHAIGTVRGGVELFPQSVSKSIITEAEKRQLIKGLDFQGTVPPEIVNALVAGGVAIPVGNITWEKVLDILNKDDK